MVRWITKDPTFFAQDAWIGHDEEWSAERYILEFWAVTEAYVAKRYAGNSRSNPHTTLDDLYGEAARSLVALGNTFHKWCADHSADATAKGLFWNLLKTRVDWDILKYLKRRTGAALSIDQMEDHFQNTGAITDLVRTELSHYRPPSALHRNIADYITTLRTREKVMLALYYFEGFPLGRIEQLTGIPSTTFSRHLKTTAERILNHALREVADQPPDSMPRKWEAEYQIPAPLTEWCQTTYNTDVYAWLGWTMRSYTRDVRYLIDFIDLAHGIEHKARGGLRREIKRSATA